MGNYFSEFIKISRFYERFNDFAKYIIVHNIAKFKYFAKVITSSKSPDHVPKSFIKILSYVTL